MNRPHEPERLRAGGDPSTPQAAQVWLGRQTGESSHNQPSQMSRRSRTGELALTPGKGRRAKAPVSDIRIQQALEHAHAAEEARALVSRHLAQRDSLIRRLYAEGEWSYSRLAKALHLTPELIAKIIRPQRRDRGSTEEAP